MSVHPIDSRVFGAGWASDELRPLFEDDGRTRGWCEVMAVLAEEEAALGIIPADAAPEITRVLRGEPVDLEEVRRTTAETHHSLLGLIRVLAAGCRGGAGEWICYGATVQDVTDTWYALTLLKVADVAERDLAGLEADLATLARAHRSTPMLGRTHGQAGLPITFGYKAAVWVDEIRRHRARLAELRPRLGVGQLAGGVGTLSGYGPRGLELQARVMARLGLGVPDISWTSARDRFAEFVVWLAFVTALLDRIGQEVYNLQRSEIGELAEAAGAADVGSITMPHKRNPERSEHLGTLARLVRGAAVLMLEAMVGDHERDGRSWKLEWAVIPESCVTAGAALLLARDLVAGLEVRADAMLRNLDERHEEAATESIMLALAPLTGKQTAHERVHAVVARARAAGRSLRDELRDDPDIGGLLPEAEIDRLLGAPSTGLAEALVDRVVGP
jgi:adenylosuccinate lyase